MKQSKWVVYTLSAGGGHLATARTLESHCRSNDLADVVVHDVVASLPVGLRLGVGVYNRVQTIDPSLWNPLKKVGQRLFLAKPPTTTSVALSDTDRLVRFLREHLEQERPDLVIINNGWIAEKVASRIKSFSSVPVAVLVTDPFDGFARGWACDSADAIVVPTETCAATIRAMNPAIADRIVLAPYPVKSTGRRAATDRPRGVIVLAGSYGHGRFLAHLETLAAADVPPMRLFFVAGRNPWLLARARERVARTKSPHAIEVHGFVEDMGALYAKADVVVTKPGPSTLLEALHAGLFVAMPERPVMAQERTFLERLVASEFGGTFDSPDELRELLQRRPPRERPDRHPLLAEVFHPDPMGRLTQVLSQVRGAA